jgi:hypothetical protein
LRNPNGMARETESGVLWAVVNEREELGRTGALLFANRKDPTLHRRMRPMGDQSAAAI